MCKINPCYKPGTYVVHGNQNASQMQRGPWSNNLVSLGMPDYHATQSAKQPFRESRALSGRESSNNYLPHWAGAALLAASQALVEAGSHHRNLEPRPACML